MTGVYKITNIHSGRFYIGSTGHNFKVRKRRHFDELSKGTHHNKPLQRAYDKYGKDALVFEILCKTDKNDAVSKEQFYIDTLKPEYNTCKVAGSVLGIKRSEKYCQNISDRMKGNTIWLGRTMSEEAKSKISIANKGRMPHTHGKERSAETKAKIKAKLTGSKRTPEAKAKMTESAHKSKLILNIETGIYYNQIKLAAEAHGMTQSYLSQCLLGKINRKKNFIYA